MRRSHISLLVGLGLIAVSSCAFGVVYLADSALEGLIVNADIIATGKVTRVAQTSATVDVAKSVKGDATGELTIYAPGKGAPRLAQDQRVIVFLSRKDGKLVLLGRMPLRSDAEETTIIACYGEIAPHAGVLHDLANAKKEMNVEKVRAAVKVLAASKNAFTQIIMGRLMEGPLAERLDPVGSTGAIEAALRSRHVEMIRGAARWAGKSRDRSLLPALRLAMENKDAAVKKYARQAIGAIESAPTSQPETQP